MDVGMDVGIMFTAVGKKGAGFVSSYVSDFQYVGGYVVSQLI